MSRPYSESFKALSGLIIRVCWCGSGPMYQRHPVNVDVGGMTATLYNYTVGCSVVGCKHSHNVVGPDLNTVIEKWNAQEERKPC